jgi:hypothetical protein
MRAGLYFVKAIGYTILIAVLLGEEGSVSVFCLKGQAPPVRRWGLSW